MGFGLALLAAAFLAAAGLLAAARNNRLSPEVRVAQRKVLAAALFNVIPGLGLWIVLKRPWFAAANLALAVIAALFVAWWRSVEPRRSLSLDNFIWIAIGSIAWAHEAAFSKSPQTGNQPAEEGRPK